MKHRIPVTESTDLSDPTAYVIEVEAESSEEAYDIANSVEDPYDYSSLPKGVRILCMRFEEILPFIREGHTARRRSWKPDLVLRSGTMYRMLICSRDIHDSQARHEVVEDWGLSGPPGTDIFAEDWELVPTPKPTAR